MAKLLGIEEMNPRDNEERLIEKMEERLPGGNIYFATQKQLIQLKHEIGGEMETIEKVLMNETEIVDTDTWFKYLDLVNCLKILIDFIN